MYRGQSGFTLFSGVNLALFVFILGVSFFLPSFVVNGTFIINNGPIRALILLG